MKRSMHNTLDKIARLVRQEKRLDVVKFCTLLDYSPATWYNYRKFIVARYEDIIFENGELVALDVDVK